MGSADSPRRALPWVVCLGVSAGALAASAAVAPGLPLPPALAYVVGFSAACAASLLCAAHVPLWTLTEALAATAVAAIAWWLVPLQPATAGSAVGLALGLWAVGSLLGSLLGARIDRPGHLAAVAVVSSLADLWSVFDPGAPSAQLAAEVAAAGPGALSRFVVPWPMLGTPYIDPMLGAGDVVFFGLYLGAARAHGLSVSRMAGALGLACGLALALIIALERPLPLLPLFGVCVLALEPAARRLEAREWRLLGVVSAGVLLALSVRWM